MKTKDITVSLSLVKTEVVETDIDSVLDEYLTLKEKIKKLDKKFKPLEKIVKEYVRNKKNVETENFIIEGHEESRSGHTVNAFKFWDFQIIRKPKVKK